MGRLGASDLNANANANAGASGGVNGFATNVRYNSQELAKQLNYGQFPSEQDPNYKAAQDAVNRVKFREYWDAELRASVYLNEFLTKNTGWLKDLKEAIYAAGLATVNQGLYAQLQAHKGEQLRRVIEVSDEREERFLEIVDQNDVSDPSNR